MIDPNVYASKVDEVGRLAKEVYLLQNAIDKSNAALEDAIRYKDALERILNIRVQDKQIVDAWTC